MVERGGRWWSAKTKVVHKQVRNKMLQKKFLHHFSGRKKFFAPKNRQCMLIEKLTNTNYLQLKVNMANKPNGPQFNYVPNKS